MTDATASRNSDLTCGARYGEAVRSAVGSLARFFAAPTNSPRELHIRPRLASWDAGTAPSQIALTAALDHAVEILQADSREPAGPVAVRLDVGLPEGTNPLGVYDLDNYLFPIVTRLGKLGVPVVSAWGTKSIGATSTIRACTAVAVELPPGAIQKIRTDTSSETAAFKLQIADHWRATPFFPRGRGLCSSHLRLDRAVSGRTSGSRPSTHWDTSWAVITRSRVRGIRETAALLNSGSTTASTPA